MLLFKIKYELEVLGGLKYAIGLDVLLREDIYTKLKSVCMKMKLWVEKRVTL